ncbi:MAG TPA: molybdenum cofactor biosynthesis protein MoaE [Gemmatimonadaceae bacterium]|jgi:molybdopterin synthase catalytic subunit|nr:molybdenum cofactor biosynthesis protein MoaE [Gemmatimonadaceae bacterium]
MRSTLTDGPIDTAALLAEVARGANGATLLFIGTVREVNDDRPVTGIEYSAYRSMAEREIADIIREASEKFGTSDIVVEHRLGELTIGDASVAIAVAHARRGGAYDASRYVIEQLKKRVPIWKLEHYVDGTREWVGAAGQRVAEAIK